MTAIGEDFSHILGQKMPQFVAVVVVLAFLLLMVVFRSLLVPLVASIMNLLSIGAALGVMTAAFQFGWGKSLLGFTKAGPIEVFMPGADVRHPVRAVHGLRGVPGQPHARGVGAHGRQSNGPSRGVRPRPAGSSPPRR